MSRMRVRYQSFAVNNKTGEEELLAEGDQVVSSSWTLDFKNVQTIDNQGFRMVDRETRTHFVFEAVE